MRVYVVECKGVGETTYKPFGLVYGSRTHAEDNLARHRRGAVDWPFRVATYERTSPSSGGRRKRK